MSGRKRRKLERKQQRKAERLRRQNRCCFGRWDIPKHARVTGWSYLTDTVRDEMKP